MKNTVLQKYISAYYQLLAITLFLKMIKKIIYQNKIIKYQQVVVSRVLLLTTVLFLKKVWEVLNQIEYPDTNDNTFSYIDKVHNGISASLIGTRNMT